MKLLLFSDVHRDLDAARKLVEKAREVDVVVGAGDFAVVHEGLEETIGVLSAIDRPAVLVPGNGETDDDLAAASAAWTTAAVCHGRGIEIEGLAFFGLGGGIPTTPWSWSFDLTEDEARAMLADCPAGAVLVVHSPPHGHVDLADDRHLGSAAILDAIREKEPPLVVCGHIHACWEQEVAIGPTREINAGPRGVVVELPD
ncbi:MAG: serine/threonine protein phosphatase [Planctomycetes bacterium]|nr:serine/threonine protein phosphatase [Planctomycetota bacterium]